MVFCKACARNVPANRGEDGFLSCSRCGKVLKFDNFSNDAMFIKNAAGQSQLCGIYVKGVDSENQSRERLYAKAHEDITSIKNGLGMGDNMAMVDQAMKYYRIAVERRFTKGRRTEQVQAVCLYIACRENRKPYLLIDFSIYLRINVFVLGAVFLQLCRVLSLEEHPIYQKLHDPSIFIHKYTASLAGEKNRAVSNTALAIIASMNRDWMQTGRMPGGIWGSALYISALAHGIRCSKTDILRLVHVCEATLMKRLVEFENTESGSLTIEELNAKVEELKKSALAKAQSGGEQPIIGELTCEHKGTGTPLFALGLCRDCYANSIGFEGGSDPPAFQRAEEQRMKKLSSSQEANEAVLFEAECGHRDERLLPPENESNGPAARYQPDGTSDTIHGIDDTSNKDLDETYTLAELDEDEVNFYVITDKKEIELKTALWEELNREFLQEQEEKRAAAGAGKKTTDEGAKGPEKEKKRAGEAKGPARTAVESCARMLTKKRLSSKVNYEALEKLFTEPEASGSKRMRTEMNDEEEQFARSDAKVKEPETKDGDVEEPEDYDNYDAEDAGPYFNDNYEDNDGTDDYDDL